MLVRFPELIADVGGDTRLDAAGPERDQNQADGEQVTRLDRMRDRRTDQCQRGMPAAVNNRQPKYNFEFSEDCIRQNGAH